MGDLGIFISPQSLVGCKADKRAEQSQQSALGAPFIPVRTELSMLRVRRMHYPSPPSVEHLTRVQASD